jgi:hypothetical protein
VIFRSILLATIVLFGSFAVAEAQFNSQGVRQGLLHSEPGTAQDVVPGWNFFHVTNCYLDSNAFYVFPAESSVINFLSTTFLVDIMTIAPACQTGNFMGVFVTNVSGSSFSWDQLFTFTFK